MEIIIRLILGFAGVLIHCLKNFDSLSKDAKAIKIDFSINDYFRADWLSISLSVIAVLVWPFLFDEATSKYPYLEGIVRFSFFVAGLLGSYGLQAFLGRGRTFIRSAANDKTEELKIVKEELVKIADGDGSVQPGKGPLV